MDNIFERDRNGEVISPNGSGYELLIDGIFTCVETAQELSTVSIREQKRIYELMGEILGKPLPESTKVLPV